MNINNMSQQSGRGTAIFALRLHTIRFPLALIAIALMFGASYLAAQSIELEYPGFMPASLLRWVDLNEEAVPPAWFSALLWQLAALLAYAVFLEHESQGYPHRTYWLSMVPLFLFLSLDETVGVHEKIGSAIESHFVFTGFLFYAWVIFGIAFVMVIGGLYVRFLWMLRRTFSALFFASASLFLSGALVVEMIGAAVESGALRAFPLGQHGAR